MRKEEKILNMQGIFWSRDVKGLDFERDKNYIIHQVLMYGSLEDISWLKEKYQSDEIKNVFIRQPQKIYTPEALNFISKIILDLKEKIDSSKYLKYAQRNIG